MLLNSREKIEWHFGVFEPGDLILHRHGYEKDHFYIGFAVNWLDRI